MNNDAQFTDKRFASLREPDDFAPNAARARQMVSEPPRTNARQWIVRAAIAAAMLLILLSLPAIHARAQSNPEAGFGHAVVEWLGAVHRHIFHVIHNW